MRSCKECGSYAINHHCHGRNGSDGDLCDVCYWKKRANEYKQQADSLKEKKRTIDIQNYTLSLAKIS